MVLANIQQGETESLRSYIEHFFAAAAKMEDVNPTVAIHNYRRGLIRGDLSKSLQLVKPKSLLDLMARASQFELREDAGNDAPDISDPRAEQRDASSCDILDFLFHSWHYGIHFWNSYIRHLGFLEFNYWEVSPCLKNKHLHNVSDDLSSFGIGSDNSS
ncbi:hypothetical protein AXF42_Ash003866 [Apostasia shenzhenica]|uniref:Retrotransposon gag domain-containing protein n=1 Tax=Apostasia shenzhenica TaxID=1088818 RepID=A0A2I0AI43_9ASPA|nr:hypothetical protein AXF42_Ash003866 [Apostasia shenzhenica]